MLRTLVRDYEYVHITVGVLGNLQFFIGSILFLDQFQELRTLAVWLFIVGAGFMLIGSLGSAVLKLQRFFPHHQRERKRQSAEAASR